MKKSLLKASLLMSLTINLANAGGFFEIGGGMNKNKFKFKDSETPKNSPSATFGIGANVDLQENIFLTFGFETSANFGKINREDTIQSSNSYPLGSATIVNDKTENRDLKIQNRSSNFLYLGFGFKANEKLGFYGKVGLAHELISTEINSQVKNIQTNTRPTGGIVIINGVPTQFYNIITTTTKYTTKSSKKSNSVGIGYGIGAYYKLSSNSSVNFEYLMKNTSFEEDNGSKTKLNNQVMRVSYRMFF